MKVFHGYNSRFPSECSLHKEVLLSLLIFLNFCSLLCILLNNNLGNDGVWLVLQTTIFIFHYPPLPRISHYLIFCSQFCKHVLLFLHFRPLFILVTWVSGFFLPVFIHIIFLYIFNFKAANFFLSHLVIVFLCISFIVLIKCYISDSCIINAKECPISVIEMNGSSQNGSYNLEKTYPGCLGRMVNLFELNIGVSPNKLLTDKPHRDGGHLFFCLFYSVLHCTYLKLEFSSMWHGHVNLIGHYQTTVWSFLGHFYKFWKLHSKSLYDLLISYKLMVDINTYLNNFIRY